MFTIGSKNVKSQTLVYNLHTLTHHMYILLTGQKVKKRRKLACSSISHNYSWLNVVPGTYLAFPIKIIAGAKTPNRREEKQTHLLIYVVVLLVWLCHTSMMLMLMGIDQNIRRTWVVAAAVIVIMGVFVFAQPLQPQLVQQLLLY